MKLHAILIDDDALVRMTWEYTARMKSKNLRVFASVRDFRDAMPELDMEAPVFIDSSLGEVKGEEYARELHEAGFREISLVTGYPPSLFPPLSQMPWLKAILGKEPVL